MFCLRSIRSLHSCSSLLARHKPLKASLSSNPEKVADDILDSLFLETTRSSQPKKEPIIEAVEEEETSRDTTMTRGRKNRRIIPPVKNEAPSISSRLDRIASKPKEIVQPEWEQDLEAYNDFLPPPRSTEMKDMSWFVGKVENAPEEFIPRWQKTKRSEDVEQAISDQPSRPTLEIEKLPFSPEALRDGFVAVLEGERASDVVVLNVDGKTDMTKFMVIATGRSKRQIYGLADACKRFARKFVHLGEFMQPEVLGIEGEDSDDWMCLDAGSVVVHCFTPEGREQYDLEGLWTNIDQFVEEIEREAEEEEERLAAQIQDAKDNNRIERPRHHKR